MILFFLGLVPYSLIRLSRLIFLVGKGGSSLPSLIASLFPNISDAPVRLQAKSLNHVFYSPDEILLYIKGFYQTEVRR